MSDTTSNNDSSNELKVQDSSGQAVRFASREDTGFWETRRELKGYYEHRLGDARMMPNPHELEITLGLIKAHLFTLNDDDTLTDRLDTEPELHEEFMANKGATPSQNEKPESINEIPQESSEDEHP